MKENSKSTKKNISEVIEKKEEGIAEFWSTISDDELREFYKWKVELRDIGASDKIQIARDLKKKYAEYFELNPDLFPISTIETGAYMEIAKRFFK